LCLQESPRAISKLMIQLVDLLCSPGQCSMQQRSGSISSAPVQVARA
jgi:hypothetical protein